MEDDLILFPFISHGAGSWACSVCSFPVWLLAFAAAGQVGLTLSSRRGPADSQTLSHGLEGQSLPLLPTLPRASVWLAHRSGPVGHVDPVTWHLQHLRSSLWVVQALI